METIFTNTSNSKANEPHRFKLNLTNKLNLKNPNKSTALANLSIYYTWINIKLEYNYNKIKISWNDTFDLPDISYSIDDIQDYFEFIIKKNETLTENPLVQIYPNRIKNRIIFKIKTGYKLELFTPETMRLLGSTKKMLMQIKPVEVVLVHCYLGKKYYQNTSKVLFSFAPNKQFGQLINISPSSLTIINTVNTEFSFDEAWFTDQAGKALETEDSVSLTLIIG